MSGQQLLSQIWNIHTNKKPTAVTELNGLKSIACQTDPVTIISVPPSPKPRDTPIRRPPSILPTKNVTALSSTQPEPHQVLIAGNPNTNTSGSKPDHAKPKPTSGRKPNPERPIITRRDSRKRDSSPSSGPYPRPQNIKRRMMVKRAIATQEMPDVRAGHRQTDGSFQQASLSRFVAPAGQQPRQDMKTPMDLFPCIVAPPISTDAEEPPPPPPLPRPSSTNTLRAPTPAYAVAAMRLQRSSCSTAIATESIAAATSLIFGDDYTTPIPIRRRNTTAVDSSLHVPTYTPLCQEPTGGPPIIVKGHRWSTPINPEGHEIPTCEGTKAVPTLPSLQAPRRKREAGVNPEPSYPRMLSEKSERAPQAAVRKRPRPNSCASESSEHHAVKRTRTTSLL